MEQKKTNFVAINAVLMLIVVIAFGAQFIHEKSVVNFAVFEFLMAFMSFVAYIHLDCKKDDMVTKVQSFDMYQKMDVLEWFAWAGLSVSGVAFIAYFVYFIIHNSSNPEQVFLVYLFGASIMIGFLVWTKLMSVLKNNINLAWSKLE